VARPDIGPQAYELVKLIAYWTNVTKTHFHNPLVGIQEIESKFSYIFQINADTAIDEIITATNVVISARYVYCDGTSNWDHSLYYIAFDNQYDAMLWSMLR
jgi:hypothetical protein